MRRLIALILLVLALPVCSMAESVRMEDSLVRYGAWYAFLKGDNVEIPEVTYDSENAVMHLGPVSLVLQGQAVNAVYAELDSSVEDPVAVLVAVCGMLGGDTAISEDASLAYIALLKQAAQSEVDIGGYTVTMRSDAGTIYLVATSQETESAQPVMAYAAQQMEAAEPEDTETQSDNAHVAVVKTGGGTLRLRAEASTKAKILAELPDGSQVTLLDYGEEWCHVSAKGQIGYVMTKFLNLD